MARSSNKSGVADALAVAVRGDNEDAIFDAAVAVGDAGEEASIPLLLRLLEDDKRVRVKNGAAIALRELCADVAVPPLIRLIEDPVYRDTRGTFVYALEPLNWYSKFSHAVARLQTEQNYEVRSMAFQALETAATHMTGGEKETMLFSLLLSTIAKFRLPGQLTTEVAETIEAASHLLVSQESIRAAQPELVA